MLPSGVGVGVEDMEKRSRWCFLKRVSSSSNSSSSSALSASPLILEEEEEDVIWKDISLSLPSLNVDHPPHPPLSASSSTTHINIINLNNHPTTTTFPSPAPAATFLSLNPHLHSQLLQQHVSDSGYAAVNETEKRKRSLLDPSSSAGNQRHKRMMKNRESAARSRARKQAYTTELELAVDNLIKENAKLKEQHKQMRLAAVAQPSRKHSLHRTFTF